MALVSQLFYKQVVILVHNLKPEVLSPRSKQAVTKKASSGILCLSHLW